jgi:hypothetical protein
LAAEGIAIALSAGRSVGGLPRGQFNRLLFGPQLSLSLRRGGLLFGQLLRLPLALQHQRLLSRRFFSLLTRRQLGGLPTFGFFGPLSGLSLERSAPGLEFCRLSARLRFLRHSLRLQFPRLPRGLLAQGLLAQGLLSLGLLSLGLQFAREARGFLLGLSRCRFTFDARGEFVRLLGGLLSKRFLSLGLLLPLQLHLARQPSGVLFGLSRRGLLLRSRLLECRFLPSACLGRSLARCGAGRGVAGTQVRPWRGGDRAAGFAWQRLLNLVGHRWRHRKRFVSRLGLSDHGGLRWRRPRRLAAAWRALADRWSRRERTRRGDRRWGLGFPKLDQCT